VIVRFEDSLIEGQSALMLTLNPCVAADAPEVLQAAGLRLLCRLWRTAGGRLYPQLRTAIIGMHSAPTY
jgi:hypothetical protein